jgi:hypothetical protein
MKPPENRRFFCVARPDLTNKIVQICSQTTGIDATEIEPIDPGKLRLFNPDCEEQLDASEDFGKWLTTSQASDPSAVVAVIIDASSESNEIARWLRDSPETVWAVGQHAFQQFQESHRIPASLAIVNSDSRSLRLLALAMLLSKSGFLCLLCLSQKAVADQTTLPIQKVLASAANTKSLGFRFVLGDSPESALETAVCSINSLQCVGGKAFSTPSSSRAGSLVLEQLKHYVEQWEAEEFEDDEVIDVIREKAEFQKKEDLAFNTRQVLLRSATLARLLATSSFEHHGCNATIVLADQAGITELTTQRESLPGRQIFDFQNHSRPTWFHLADQWLREDGIETSLSSRSVLLVDILTGRVLSVWELNAPADTRFETLNQLTLSKGSHPVFAIAALESGYVEIHHQGALTFWYDRYRWRHDPFGRMRRRILESHVLPRGSEEQTLEKICAAISILMDAQESSILVFVRPEHQPQLNSLLTPMRPMLGLHQEHGLHEGQGDTNTAAAVNHKQSSTPRATFTGGRLQDFLASTLASVFRLDGAHVICDGQITCFAHRIVLPVPPAQQSDSGGGGTGRKAAQQVAESVPGSVVVKVSSSGELQVYSVPHARR